MRPSLLAYCRGAARGFRGAPVALWSDL